jgi:hypothetical protein
VVDYSIGAIVNIGSKFTLCPTDKVDVTLYTQADILIDFNLFSFAKQWSVYNTGKIGLAKHLGSTCNGVAVPTINGPVTIPDGSLKIPVLGSFDSGSGKIVLEAPRGNLTFVEAHQAPINPTVVNSPIALSRGIDTTVPGTIPSSALKITNIPPNQPGNLVINGSKVSPSPAPAISTQGPHLVVNGATQLAQQNRFIIRARRK